MRFHSRSFIIACAFVFLTSCDQQEAPAKPDPRSFSEALASDGLAAAEKNLLSQPKSPGTDFLLAGVQFLRAIEDIQQIRYANYRGELSWLPGMRTQLPANQEAKFDPAFLEKAMTAALGHLRKAQATVAGAVGQPFTAELQLSDVWFDINANGTRDEWESLLHMMAQLRASPREDFDGIIRFDTADADWLKAYIHFISGMAELTLAVDPTPAIRKVTQGRDRLAEFGPLAAGPMGESGTLPETIAATLIAFRGKPSPKRTRAALGHFKALTVHARAFWDKVAEETDNDHEWLPNPNQVSAFGVEVTAETSQEWRGVLSELEAILEGEALVPFWRFEYPPTDSGNGIGVDIGKLLQDPPDMDLILLVQGTSLAPYLETGRLANMEAWTRFSRSVRGNAFLFAMWMN